MVSLLIFGGSGELGQAVKRAAMEHGAFETLYSPGHHFTDVANHGDAQRAIETWRPDVVVNCAGIVRGRIDVPDSEYVAVNALAPYYIAEACQRYGAKMVQVSTDCVFSGQRLTRWYLPSDIPDPIDLYGRTKALGEVQAAHVAVVRTSFTGRTSRLWRWLASDPGPIVDGWAAQLWSGSTSRAVAEALVDLIAKDEMPWGQTFHLATEMPISKAQAVERLVQHLGRTNLIVRAVYEPRANMALSPDIVLPSFEEALDAERVAG